MAFIVGTANDDFLIGTELSDTLEGLSGDDRLAGGRGPDRLDGGDGFDIAIYADSGFAVRVDLVMGFGHTGDATGDRLLSIEGVHGSQLNDELDGNIGDNSLFGLGGRDTIDGMGGNDRISGGEGADTLTGGSGVDTLIYLWSWRGVEINLSNGFAAFGDAKDDVISGFENIVGSRFDDVLTGSNGANRIRGNAGDDELFGLRGQDVLIGGAGGDLMDGGNGFDLVTYQLETESVAVNLLSGQMLGAAAGDTLVSIEGLRGTDFDDSLIMNGADNRVFGLDGDDFIDAGRGDDFIFGGAGADFMHGDLGTDTVSYTRSDAAVQVSMTTAQNTGGHAEGDTLSAVENIDGSDFGDTIEGNALDNRLRGGDGDDQLTGRGGLDVLLGGAGADSFVFVDLADHNANAQSQASAINAFPGSRADRIRDFEQGTDGLVFDAGAFSGDVFNSGDVTDLGLTSATDSAFAFNGGGLFYVIYASAADFAADQVTVYHLADLVGVGTLSSDDFAFF